MPWILEGQDYRILFIHQNDKRPFNRGAIKNIGFLYVKTTYPNNYKNIVLIFHDIDYMAWRQNQFDFTAKKGLIKHYFGFDKSLGGIFSIMAGDFELLNGFPNIWTWGLEDNILYNRSRAMRIRVDKSKRVCTQEGADNIIGLWHGWDRLINPNIHNKMAHDNGQDGISCLHHVKYNEDVFPENSRISMVHVNSFNTAESLSSPFVRGAKQANARFFATFKGKQIRHRKVKRSFLNLHHR